MRLLTLILLLTISNLASGQVYKSLLVDENKDFSFKNEGKIVKWWDEPATVNSNMLVNGDTLTDIQFTKAKLRGDTLDIEIYQFDESHDHHYKITIIGTKYNIDYDFTYPVDTVDRKIKTLNFSLILNSKEFMIGKEIKGYTEFKGKCVKNCYDKIIVAKGLFKVKVE